VIVADLKRNSNIFERFTQYEIGGFGTPEKQANVLGKGLEVNIPLILQLQCI